MPPWAAEAAPRAPASSAAAAAGRNGRHGFPPVRRSMHSTAPWRSDRQREVLLGPGTPIAESLEQLARDRPPWLGVAEYRPFGSLLLVADLAAVVDAAGLSGDCASQLACSVACGLVRQHSELVYGFACQPGHRRWHRLAALELVLQETDAAPALLQDALAAQSLVVQVDGTAHTVPVSARAARLPADHVQVTLRGLPTCYAREGVLEALLRGCGYTPESAMVVHERAGVASLSGGEVVRVPVLDMTVGVVHVDREDALLRNLPARLLHPGGAWVIEVQVESAVLRSSTPLLRSPPPPRPARPTVAASGGQQHLSRVFVAHGVTAEVVAGAAGPVADEVLRMARQPGDRRGLGDASVAAPLAPSPPLPPPAPPASAAGASPPELPMPQAAPLPQVPLDDPVFDAACQLLVEEADLQSGEAQQVVLAVRAHAPSAYGSSAGVTRPAQLSRELRQALHAQASSLVGEEQAAPLLVLPSLPATVDELLSEGSGSEGEGPPAAPVQQQPPPGQRRRLDSAPSGSGVAAPAAPSAPAAPPSAQPRRSSRPLQRPQPFWMPSTPQQPRKPAAGSQPSGKGRGRPQ